MAQLERTLKKAVAALEERQIPYLLGGTAASWAHGGPEPGKDVDLMIKREDAEAALAALQDAGMRTERPPEQWLFKAWDEDVLVDLIFGPSGLAIDDALISRGQTLGVAGMHVRVMALEDLLVTKLMALDEHALDYGSLVRIARALREKVDWAEVARRTANSPFARAFFTLAEGLELIDAGLDASPKGDVHLSAGGGQARAG